MTDPTHNPAAAPPASMTGYARAAGRRGREQWVWEARSVNNKGLETRVRLPSGHDALELKAKEAVAKRFARGSVNLTLELRRDETPQTIQVNRALLEQILNLQQELAGKVDSAPMKLEQLLSLRGVLESTASEPEVAPEEAEARFADLLAGLEQALDALARARAEEGVRLQPVLLGQVAEIERLTLDARRIAAGQIDRAADRMRRAVADLREQIPADRLAQEIALLAAKADATEELDRLTAHAAQARELLGAGKPAGRKLDFLAQEFHREANTLTAKSGDLSLTRLGLALKTVIEQFREQIQNVE